MRKMVQVEETAWELLREHAHKNRATIGRVCSVAVYDFFGYTEDEAHEADLAYERARDKAEEEKC